MRKTPNALLLATGLFLFLLGCQAEPASADDQLADVPALLDRNEKIQAGKEWEFVQNEYMKNKVALGEDPQDHDAALALVELYVREARVTGEHGHYYPAALTVTDGILADKELDRDLHFRALTTRAGVELSLHQFDQALKTAKAAARLNPVNAQVQGVLVDCYVELGDYENAIAAADRMMSIKPDLRSYSRISYLREIHGDVPGAITAMELAIKSGFPAYEETAWSMQTLGDLYLEYGEVDKAQQIYEEILTVRPNYPFAVAALGEVEYRRGNLEAAEQRIRQAIDIIPEVGFYVQLAQLHKDRNETEALKATVKEIHAMLEDDEAAGHNMNMEYAAIYRDLLEDYATAETYAQKEYDKRPDNIDVNRLMAELAWLQNRNESARDFLTTARKTKSVHPDLAVLERELLPTEES